MSLSPGDKVRLLPLATEGTGASPLRRVETQLGDWRDHSCHLPIQAIGLCCFRVTLKCLAIETENIAQDLAHEPVAG